VRPEAAWWTSLSATIGALFNAPDQVPPAPNLRSGTEPRDRVDPGPDLRLPAHRPRGRAGRLPPRDRGSVCRNPGGAAVGLQRRKRLGAAVPLPRRAGAGRSVPANEQHGAVLENGTRRTTLSRPAQLYRMATIVVSRSPQRCPGAIVERRARNRLTALTVIVAAMRIFSLRRSPRDIKGGAPG
jgi:hypothetical protein